MTLGLRVASGVLMLALAACGRAGSDASRPPAPAQATDSGYRAAPQITGLAVAADGSVSLDGRAMPSSQVRLASPAGAQLETTADGQGDWKTALGPVSEPILYGLSAENAGRRIQGEGYVAVLPSAASNTPTVALLRAGSGAQVMMSGPLSLRLLALDVDGGGATVVSGSAPAGELARVMVDGITAIEVSAGADGRFSTTLPKALPPGQHQIAVLTAKARSAAAMTVGPIAPLTEGPYRAEAGSTGWRVDWLTPGGGPQTTLLIAATRTGH